MSNIITHHIDLDRNPYNFKQNRIAYKQMLNLIREEKFDVIHCNTPIGGLLGRLCGKKAKVPKIIYTAHGFHFYQGAPLINWLLYFPAERFLARDTDVLITMNKEDYERAKKYFNSCQLEYIPGIGINTQEIEIDRNKKRPELQIPEETMVLLSVGEMIERKNHETALRALAKLENQNYLYLICGRGKLESYLKKRAEELGIEDRVKFLGFRNDISEICIASDIFVFPSFQEGLPVAVMEAMAAGLPVVGSSIRGNVDLIQNGEGGFLIKPNDIEGFSKSIDEIMRDSALRRTMGLRNLNEAKKYDVEIVKNRMQEIYNSVLA
ncbi:glycosyltransferase [Acetobacterium fimetarium]|uniref:Glycosyltransferase n=1 Tax=Acetobacterium fimetarium TaxID=52691 RepID=A0ABR6WYT5_9FIRM|nr:glycosyltransferase family 4 protein [Acetobacterium fimetarium]MBC3805603.1 glycosyltransferase [Acetobacterium fimetarium]